MRQLGIINVLDESVANLIAAGEVAEKPASVIKELVENSLDAGAKNITVEIKHGGMSYMRVTDDGCGIAAEDVGIAFLRHATSKIKTAADLSKIGTLGFRGEALCSIAAVSNICLTTKTEFAQGATRVVVEGGVMEDVLSVGAPNGTTIEVRKLFYNTPARMKFLKKDTTEAGYVADVVEKFILANPNVSFKFINNGKQVLFSAGDGNPVTAIFAVYGKDYAKSVIKVSYMGENMSLEGFIGKSNISRPNRAYQSFFVNGRNIKSAIMTKALEEAYKNQLMGGKFPFAVLDLKINTEGVDVNVHPHKTEVKFSDERQVFETVYWGVKNALYEKNNIPQAEIKEKKPFGFNNSNESFESISFEAAAFKYESENKDAKEDKPFNAAKPFGADKSTAKEIKTYADEVLKKGAQMRESLMDLIPSGKNDEIKKDEKQKTENQTDDFKLSDKFESLINNYKTEDKNISFEGDVLNSPSFEQEKAIRQIIEKKLENEEQKTKENVYNEDIKEDESFKVCGAVFNTYIIVQKGADMLLIDQHAAHERIKFEQIKKDIASGSEAIQQLMVSALVNLSSAEYEFAQRNKEKIEKMGFDFEFLGYPRVMINALPYALCEYNPEDVFVELLGEVMDNKKQVISADYERALYTVACKAAIKANRRLSAPEMESLVKKVFEMENINTCPHGRPIMISFSKYEIEKQFKRIV